MDTYPLDKIKKAIKGSWGQIGEIARRLEVERSLVIDYCQRFPEIMQALADEEENKKDIFEKAFISLVVDEMNPSAIIFAMKTLCKDRGYSENVQMKPTQMQLFEMKTEYDLGRLTDDELSELERINRKLEGKAD